MKRLFALICVLVLTAALIPVGASADNYWYVKTPNGKSLNLRREPKSGNNVVTTAKYREKLRIVRYMNDTWAEVMPMEWVGNTLFCQRRYLVSKDPGKYTPPKQETDTGAEKYTSFKLLQPEKRFEISVVPSRPAGSVNFRWAPSKDAAVIAKLYSGRELTVSAVGKKWYQAIDNETGAIGYIMISFTGELN